MELVTITEVTKRYHISTRTLRYYEQLGLLVSSKKEGYAYRTYDADALKRLEKILVLRKFRIPLKDIQRVLQSEGGEAAQIAFQAKLHERMKHDFHFFPFHSLLNALQSAFLIKKLY